MISIIIPAWNAEQFLEETLASVAAQTYFDWEVILVEDGSKDRTEEILEEFRSSVSQDVRYIRQYPNQGAAIARNTAIRAAKGDYIAFLDSDDIWEPNHLQLAVEALEKEAIDLVWSSVYVFNTESNLKERVYGPSKEEIENFPNSLLSRMGSYILPSSVVMKQEIVEVVGGFDSQCILTEDYDYFIRIAAAGFKFLHLETISSLWRRGHSSASSNFTRTREMNTNVLLKHKSAKVFPPEVWEKYTSFACLAVAKDFQHTNPIKSARFLFEAWKICPLKKFKYLSGILLLIFRAFVFSFSSKLFIKQS